MEAPRYEDDLRAAQPEYGHLPHRPDRVDRSIKKQFRVTLKLPHQRGRKD
jgi:hypothetical protein